MAVAVPGLVANSLSTDLPTDDSFRTTPSPNPAIPLHPIHGTITTQHTPDPPLRAIPGTITTRSNPSQRALPPSQLFNEHVSPAPSELPCPPTLLNKLYPHLISPLVQTATTYPSCSVHYDPTSAYTYRNRYPTVLTLFLSLLFFLGVSMILGLSIHCHNVNKFRHHALSGVTVKDACSKTSFLTSLIPAILLLMTVIWLISLFRERVVVVWLSIDEPYDAQLVKDQGGEMPEWRKIPIIKPTILSPWLHGAIVWEFFNDAWNDAEGISSSKPRTDTRARERKSIVIYQDPAHIPSPSPWDRDGDKHPENATKGDEERDINECITELPAARIHPSPTIPFASSSHHAQPHELELGFMTPQEMTMRDLCTDDERAGNGGAKGKAKGKRKGKEKQVELENGIIEEEDKKRISGPMM